MRPLRFLSILALFGSLAGCGERFTFGEVEGQVTLNGKPLSQAGVAFLPDGPQGTRGPVSRAVTDDKGRFKLAYEPNKFGAVVGIHRVLVDDAKAKAEHLDYRQNRVASCYEGVIDNPLGTREVKPGSQTINLELKSK